MATIDRLYRNLPYWYRESAPHLSALLGSVATGIDGVASDLADALLMVELFGATGIWLSWWGSVFGLTQLPGETEDNFLSRILQQLDPRLTTSSVQSFLDWFSSIPVVASTNTGGTSIGRTFSQYRLDATGTSATYTRNSVAYSPIGDLVDIGVPIYNNTAFGNDAGLWLWGPTTNLLTPNQSDIEAGTTSGFTAVGSATISATTALSWQGSYSLSTVASGIGDGVELSTSGLTPSTWYTASTWAQAPSGALIDITLVDNSGVSIASLSEVTLSGTWTRIALSGETSSAGSGITWTVAAGSGSPTWYMDGLQLEASMYATPWQDANNAIRSGSELSYTGPALYNQGAFQAWFEPGWLSAGSGAINGGPLSGEFPLVACSNGVELWATLSGYLVTTGSTTVISGPVVWDSGNFVDYSWYNGTVQLSVNGAVAYSGAGPNLAGTTLTFGSDASGNVIDGSYGPWRVLNMPTASGNIEPQYALIKRLQGHDINNSAEEAFYTDGRTLYTFLGSSLDGYTGVDRIGAAWYGRVNIAFDLSGSIADAAYCDISYMDTPVFYAPTGLAPNAVGGVQNILNTVRPVGIKLIPNFV